MPSNTVQLDVAAFLSKRFEYYRSVKGEAENKEKVGVWLLVSEIVVDVPCYPSCRSNIE
jgi:hypothetical protein